MFQYNDIKITQTKSNLNIVCLPPNGLIWMCKRQFEIEKWLLELQNREQLPLITSVIYIIDAYIGILSHTSTYTTHCCKWTIPWVMNFTCIWLKYCLRLLITFIRISMTSYRMSNMKQYIVCTSDVIQSSLVTWCKHIKVINSCSLPSV